MFFLLSSSFGVWRSLNVSVGDDTDPAPVTSTTPDAVAAVFITVRVETGSETMLVTVNGVDVALDQLRSELDRLADAGADDAVLVPREGTAFQQVVRVLDAARASKLERVGLRLN